MTAVLSLLAMLLPVIVAGIAIILLVKVAFAILEMPGRIKRLEDKVDELSRKEKK